MSLRLEARGRGGRAVTRMVGLPTGNLEAIVARLRKALGCEVTIEGDDVLVAGSLVDRISAWLDQAGDLRSIVDDRPQPVARPAADPPDPAPAADASGTRRSDVRRGQHVAIVLKADQETGQLTRGIVRDLLTSSPTHPRGIKVRLESGEVGRVKIIYES